MTRFQYSEVISKGLWVEQVLNDKGDQQEEGGDSQKFWMKIRGLDLVSDSGSEMEELEKRAHSDIKWIETCECLDMGDKRPRGL